MITQDTFFGQNSFEDGIMINYRGEAFWSFWQLSILIADEVAIKQSIESKGAAARLFCCRCWNVISKFSWDNAVGTSVGMHGCFSVQAAHQWICAEGRQVLGGTTWEDVKSAVLQTWDPAWLQLDTFRPAENFSTRPDHSWLYHVRLVPNRKFALLLELWCRLGSVVAWKLFWLLLSGPSNFRVRSLPRSLAREIAALGPYRIIRVFIVQFVWEQHPQARPACKTALKFCEILIISVHWIVAEHARPLISMLSSRTISTALWLSMGMSFGSQSAI